MIKMKKTFLLLLILLMALAVFAGCSNNDDVPITPDEPIDDNTSSEPTPLKTESNIVFSILEYLYEPNKETSSTHYMQQIQSIQDGVRPLLLDYTASDTYFVCGYYTFLHTDEENSILCCARHYTWVRYEKAEDIKECHGGETLMSAFQVNTPGTVKDLLDEDAKTPPIEHFMPYNPTFSGGANTAQVLPFDEVYIYVNNSDNIAICHSLTRKSTKDKSIIPGVKLDGEYYLCF
jgi:hypothetical protein